ncbi:NfeD family protein [Bacteroides sp. 224]|uniref:NfeD family protein n=1 Tax=Bacteroides sp. 224 TaxID=2302936 RepID=UPI0013D2F93C|nr:NfeD family protein [Bacteroides sp. 224]NDV65918.1 nodulation efficiency protein D (NfeD) [Bacteroides sp. 224]
MDILIIVLLIIAAVILFLAEAFFIPGTSVAGFAGLGCLAYANYYAFVYMGTLEGFITLIISIIACVASVVLFMKSKTLDKVSLTKEISSKVDRHAEHSLKIGDAGVTTTRLALIGHAEINGKIVEVKSTNGFLDEKTPVVVSRISDGVVLVEKQAN